MPKRHKSSPPVKCRICLCHNGAMTDIFTSQLRGMIKELAASTSIQIDEDERFPRNICHVCLYKLDMWCNFKAQFLRSHEKLMQQLGVNELSDNAVSSAKRKPSSAHLPVDSKNDELVSSVKLKKRSSASPSTKLPEPEAPQESIDSPLPPVTPSLTLDSASEPTRDATPGPKPRPSVGRRTSEQRLASTQRWEARKKARLAATGENDSDSDSVGIDDKQLSPIQKARAKNNAEKVAERQRRSQETCVNLPFLDHVPQSDLMQSILNTTNPQTKDEESDDFQPQSLQAEVMIGDATYVVTSTLLLTDPNTPTTPQINQANAASQSNKSKAKIDDTPNYQNTDIMDAVQLKRVEHPSKPKTDQKLIERCVNIEVQGTELSTLLKVQTSLANFIENDVKQKVLCTTDETVVLIGQNSAITLENKLKNIVEKAIRDNFENAKMKPVPMSKIATTDKVNKTFSTAFIQAATKSPVFQPKVVLNRLSPKVEEMSKESRKKIENDNNNGQASTVGGSTKVQTRRFAPRLSHTPNILKSSRFEPAPSTKHEAPATTPKSHQPPPVVDCFIIATPKTSLNFMVNLKTSANLKEPSKTLTPVSEPKPAERLNKIVENDKRGTELAPPDSLRDSPKTLKPLKIDSIPGEKLPPKSLESTRDPKPIDKQNEPPDTPEISEPKDTPELRNEPIETSKANDESENNSHVENKQLESNDSSKRNSNKKLMHVCRTCGEVFSTETKLSVHLEIHKWEVERKLSITSNAKQKMMRCKMCHAIVEARWVKSHVCKMAKYKCHMCNKIFKLYGWLVKHLKEFHNETIEEIERVTNNTVVSQNFDKITVSSELLAQQIVRRSFHHNLPMPVNDSPGKQIDSAVVNDTVADNTGNPSVTENVTEESDKTVVSKAEQSTKQIPPQVVLIDEVQQKIYSCFVCDKNFSNDKVLKEHFQEHCENMSEEENGEPGKMVEAMKSMKMENLKAVDKLDTAKSEDKLGTVSSETIVHTVTSPTNVETKIQKKKIYQCAICGDNLDTEVNLERHVERHLFGDDDDLSMECQSHVEMDRQFHTCVQCAQQFDTELDLVMHMQQHEEEAAFTEWDRQGARDHDHYGCTICSETFDTEETLANHLDLHNGSCHICELCDRPFWTIGELQEHIVEHCA